MFDIAERVRANDIPTITDIVISDSVSDAISDFAARQNVSLIALATHGRGGVARMLRGSVADALLHSVPVCMLVLKPQAAEDAAVSTIAVHAELIPA